MSTFTRNKKDRVHCAVFMYDNYSKAAKSVAGIAGISGIYAKLSDALAVVKGTEEGCAHVLPSLECAESFWFNHANQPVAPLIHSVGKETMKPMGQVVYIGDNGLKVSLRIAGDSVEKVLRFMRTENMD